MIFILIKKFFMCVQTDFSKIHDRPLERTYPD